MFGQGPMRQILLADADAFYVAAASSETRKFGVRSAMPIARALRLCPEAMCVPVPFKECIKKSAEIRKTLQQYTPVVEGASIDEWYLDLTGTEGVYHHEPLLATAHRIRAGLREATGLTLSIGGGTNKLIAKMAVDRAKPTRGGRGVLIIAPGTEQGVLGSCTLAAMP